MEAYLYPAAISNRINISELNKIDPNLFLNNILEKKHIAIYSEYPLAILLSIHEFYKYKKLIDRYNTISENEAHFKLDYFRLFDENKYFPILKNKIFYKDIFTLNESIADYIEKNKWCSILKNQIPIAIIISVNDFVELLKIEECVNIASLYYEAKLAEQQEYKNSKLIVEDKEIIDDSGFDF